MSRIHRRILNAAVKCCVSTAAFPVGNSRKAVLHQQTANHRRTTPMTVCRTTLAQAIALALSSSTAFAAPAPSELPSGGQVSSGSASIAVNGSHMDVNQASQNASLNWQTFNIGQNAQVDFHQPNTSAIAVNRIADTNGSQIMGQLNANGQVYLINPNGILFGQGAQVNVGGLVASTLDMNDADLDGNSRTFSGSGKGSVINRGALYAANGGTIALLGNHVSNEGVITAQLGTVALGAGSAVTLTFNGNNLVQLQVDQSTLNNLAENNQLIQADGGQVLMTAGAKDALLASVVNNTGVIEARTIENHNGVITLLGGMTAGTVNVGGTLNASAPNGGDGGFIETSAAHVHIADDAHVTTLASQGKNGTWLIDPVDFTIAASGGDMTGAAVGAALAGGNFTVQSTTGGSGTSGNVNVNDAVGWSANKLTLNAQNNINIKANLNGSGTASLALEYGQASAGGGSSTYTLSNGAQINLPAGNNFSTKLGTGGATTSYTVITSLGTSASSNDGTLQGMIGNLNNTAANYVLGANIDASGTNTWNGGSGFAPIGDNSSFTNATRFLGNFHGLGHTITSLTISRAGSNFVGLFGYATGTLRDVGLLSSSVSGLGGVGMLAGYSTGAISYSYADGGSVTGGNNGVGGLVGSGTGTIDYSYTNVSVTGGNTGTGGMRGAGSGNISNSYATGSAAGVTDVGGLTGQMTGGGTISNSYATGAVTGTLYVGGLTGSSNNLGGAVSVSNSYWDKTTSGKATSYGGTGLTTALMQTLSSFNTWNIANSGGSTAVWRIYEGHTAPLLNSFLTPLTVTSSASKTYDGLAFSGGSVTYSTTPNANLLGTVSYSGSSQGAVNAGSYVLTPSGLYSNQRGYNISYVDGGLTVNKATLTYNATPVLLFNGQNLSNVSGTVSGFVAGDTLANSTNGSLIWTTTAETTGQADQYPINGGGLTATNYVFAQAAGNATALTLKHPRVFQNPMAQLESTILSPPVNDRPATPGLSSTDTVAQNFITARSSPESVSKAVQNNTDQSSTVKIGENGPTFSIVHPGVKLPDNWGNVNE